MGVIARQGVKTTIVSYIGVAIGALNTLWLFPAFLEVREIGLLNLMTNISLLIAPIAQLGVNGIILKYHPFFKNDEERYGQFLWLVTLIPFLGYFFAMSIFLLFQDTFLENFIETSPLIVEYYLWLIPLTFIVVFRNVADTMSRALFRIAVPKFIKEVVFRIIVMALLVCIAVFDLSRTTLIMGYIGAFGINLLLVLGYIYRLSPQKPIFNLKGIDKSFIKEAFTYGLFIILSGFAGMIVTKIDGWMIGSMLDLDNVGIYSIALFIGLTIEMPKRSINLISMPVIANAIKNNRPKEIETLYKKSALTQMVLGCALLTPIWIGIDDLFALIPNSEVFAEGKYVVLWIGLAVVFDMATGVNNEIILMSNFYRYNLGIMSALVGLAIVNNLWLIPIYGITGAAMATAISIFIFNLLKFLLVFYKFHIQPFSIKSLWILLLTCGVMALGLYLPDLGHPLVNILYRSVIVLGLFGGAVLYFKLSPEIAGMVNKLLGTIRRNT
ncbi:MAG: lipopolysaccharide biosynthesis protein [Salibacteraceae bacterium]